MLRILVGGIPDFLPVSIIDIDVVARCAKALKGHIKLESIDAILIKIRFGDGPSGGAIWEGDSTSKDDGINSATWREVGDKKW